MIINRTKDILQNAADHKLITPVIVSDACNASLKELKRETNYKLFQSYRSAGRTILTAPANVTAPVMSLRQ